MRGVVVALLLWAVPVAAQDFALTTDSELGFQRLIRAAQMGQLGEDVANANVGVEKSRVRVELLRRDGTRKLLLLTHKNSAQAFSRFFDIELGAAATEADAVAVGKLLDAAFGGDPFIVSLDFLGASADGPRPGLMEAWRYGSWKSVLAVLAHRMIAPRGVVITVTLIIGLTIAVFASLMLLWGYTPPHLSGRRAGSEDI